MSRQKPPKPKRLPFETWRNEAFFTAEQEEYIHLMSSGRYYEHIDYDGFIKRYLESATIMGEKLIDEFKTSIENKYDKLRKFYMNLIHAIKESTPKYEAAKDDKRITDEVMSRDVRDVVKLVGNNYILFKKWDRQFYYECTFLLDEIFRKDDPFSEIFSNGTNGNVMAESAKIITAFNELKKFNYKFFLFKSNFFNWAKHNENKLFSETRQTNWEKTFRRHIPRQGLTWPLTLASKVLRKTIRELGPSPNNAIERESFGKYRMHRDKEKGLKKSNWMLYTLYTKIKKLDSILPNNSMLAFAVDLDRMPPANDLDPFRKPWRRTKDKEDDGFVEGLTGATATENVRAVFSTAACPARPWEQNIKHIGWSA